MNSPVSTSEFALLSPLSKSGEAHEPAPMILVNVSELPWLPSSPRRNQAVFLELLRCSSAITEAIYVVPPPKPKRSRLADYWSQPKLDIVDRFTRHGKPVVVVRPVILGACSGRSFMPQLICRAIVAQLRRRYLDRRTYWLWMNNAELFSYWISVYLTSGASLRVFDASDDFESFSHSDPAAFRTRVRHLIQTANKVLCVNQHVAGRIDHPKKLVFPNCTDFTALTQEASEAFELPPIYPKPPGAVYAGFIGGLHRGRVDVSLLNGLLSRFPDYRFVFVGYTNSEGLVAELSRHANFVFLPEVPYSRLGSVIKGFDVAIVPHLDNELTKGNDLLKVLDYLACGVPVVATDCSNIRQYGNAVYVAASEQQFAGYIAGLATGAISHDAGPGLAIAKSRSWPVCVPGLLPWLEQS